MKRFKLLLMRTSQYKKVDNFQRNGHGGSLVFQNEVNFSPREAYLSMKISRKFCEATASRHNLAATHLNVSNRQMCGCTGFKSGIYHKSYYGIMDHSTMIQAFRFHL